jgi:hypothetical protein
MRRSHDQYQAQESEEAMTAKRWVNAGAEQGLWFRVTNGTQVIHVATSESAAELVAILDSLERDAAFGRQCIQDSCEGAWVAATVHKQAVEEARKQCQPSA